MYMFVPISDACDVNDGAGGYARGGEGGDVGGGGISYGNGDGGREDQHAWAY